MQRPPEQRHETLRTIYHGYHQRVLLTFSRFTKVRRGAGENIVTIKLAISILHDTISPSCSSDRSPTHEHMQPLQTPTSSRILCRQHRLYVL
eukprot:5693761-Ditylum_brightwellii.AAC.1